VFDRVVYRLAHRKHEILASIATQGFPHNVKPTRPFSEPLRM